MKNKTKKIKNNGLKVFLLIMIVILLLATSIGFINKNKLSLEKGNRNSFNVVSQTLASQITGNDYGKSINYSVNINGTTLNNWKVFLNDGNNVYIILDDYLPNSLFPSSAGLQKYNTYNVNSTTSKQVLLDGLITQNYWADFAKGIKGATATGGPTIPQLVASWNANPAVNSRVIQENVPYYNNANGGYLVDSSRLYMATTGVVDNCYGYWLPSNYPGLENNL